MKLNSHHFYSLIVFGRSVGFKCWAVIMWIPGFQEMWYGNNLGASLFMRPAHKEIKNRRNHPRNDVSFTPFTFWLQTHYFNFWAVNMFLVDTKKRARRLEWVVVVLYKFFHKLKKILLISSEMISFSWRRLVCFDICAKFRNVPLEDLCVEYVFLCIFSNVSSNLGACLFTNA